MGDRVHFQSFRREVPERGAWIRRAALVHPSFGVTVLELHGLAQDWGAQGELVSFLPRLARTQLSIVLAGRGYFGADGRALGPGDVVVSDQRLLEPEGYFGEPALVLIVEHAEDTLFGATHRGPARGSRLGPRDVRRLRELVACLPHTPHARWVVALAVLLRSLGLGVEPGAEVPPADLSRAAPILDAMGRALSNLAAFPSLDEVADSLELGERQARRQMLETFRELDHPYDGWREFLSDARLGWVTQLLSIPGLSQARVAALAGFRSPVALAHAFSRRTDRTPGAMARELAHRWRT